MKKHVEQKIRFRDLNLYLQIIVIYGTLGVAIFVMGMGFGVLSLLFGY